MRYKFVFLTLILLAVPLSAFGEVTGSDIATSSGDEINFDPSQNFIGNNGQPLLDSSGSITALTYLSGSDDPATIAIRLINLALGFLGTISLLMMLYAGFVWFTARDNEEEAKRAKQILVGSVTGLVITLSAYGIAYLVFSLTNSAASGTLIIR